MLKAFWDPESVVRTLECTTAPSIFWWESVCMLVYIIFLECIFYKIYKLNAWPTAGDMKSGQQDHLYATYRNHFCSSSLWMPENLHAHVCGLKRINSWWSWPIANLQKDKRAAVCSTQGVLGTEQPSVFETVEKPTFLTTSVNVISVSVKGQIDDVFAGLFCHFATTSSD